MTSLDPHRRHSNSASSPSNPRNIPPAPPLPPDTGDHHRPAPGFLDRFLYGPRRLNQHVAQQLQAHQSQHQHTQPPNQTVREHKGQLLYTQSFGTLVPDAPKPSKLTLPTPSHDSSQNTGHRTGLKLRALDINESRSHVVLAGVKILKTVRVHQASCTEDVNIRSAAVNYVWRDDRPRGSDAHHDVASVQREAFDIEDVAWSSQRFSSHIATAASNGKIMLYDLNRPGVEVGRLYEHHRQVHKVDFNPHEAQFLLSGSQDGTVRLWDLRSPRRVIECKSKDMFPGRSDGIRHTKWSPTNNWSFALGTDNGTIQRWDIRQNRAPVLKILAHTKTCTSIDWHPDGRHMISASKDQNVKVWDLLADRRQKPAFEVRCPRPVQNVRWRPPCYVADGADQWIKQCTHFATSYRHHPSVHVWDLKRPYMPYREFYHQINSGTTDLLWHSQDLLWVVGPEGEFCQSDVRYMPRVIDRRPLQAFAEAPTGELSFFSQERPRFLSSGSAIVSDRERGDLGSDRPKRHHSGSPNLTVGSHGREDGPFEERFLSTSLPKRHSRSSSFKSGGSLAATPPSYEDFAKPVTQLDQTMGSLVTATNAQISKVGRMPVSDLGPVFDLLSRRFRPFVAPQSWSFRQAADRLDEHLSSLEHQSELAGDYESAQTIHFLRTEFDRVLDLWEETPAYFDLRQRSRLFPGPASRGPDSLPPKRPSNKALMQVKESARDRLHSDDDASNVTTPLARPLRSPPGERDRPETPTIDLGAGTLFDSPDAPELPRIERSPSEDAMEPDESDPDAPVMQLSSVVDGMAASKDFLGKSREPLRFDQLADQVDEHLPVHLRLDRRDSSDSFQMFPTSWGTDQKLPATDSNASSWTKNAAANYGRHPSFRSQISSASEGWRSEGGKSDPAFDGSVDSSDGSSSARRHQSHQGLVAVNRSFSGDDAILEEPATQGTASSAGSTEADDSFAGATLDPPARTPSAIPDVTAHDMSTGGLPDEPRSPSVISHPESRTVLDDSIASLPPIVPHSQALLDAPQQVQQALETIEELLQYHSVQDEVRTASQLFLSIAPILPYMTATVLASTDYGVHDSFHEAVSSVLSIPSASVSEALKACHAPLEAANMSPFHIESLLTSLHSQLFASGLDQEAALLRRVAFPAFPGVYETGIKDVDVGTLCASCRAPINNELDPLRCESCGVQQADCPVCWSKSSPFPLHPDAQSPTDPLADQPHRVAAPDTLAGTLFPLYAALRDAPPREHDATALWTACGLCAHTAHAACALAWFTDAAADGACPVPGCACDCAPGAWRNERVALERARADGGARAGSGSEGRAVRRDDWEVGESSAVRKAVGALRGDRDGAVSEGEGTAGARAEPRRSFG